VQGSKEKAEIFACHFSNKIKVPDPNKVIKSLPRMTTYRTTRHVSSIEVEQQLCNLDTSKAVGPDDISPRTLKMCAIQLALPLATLPQLSISPNMAHSMEKSKSGGYT